MYSFSGRVLTRRFSAGREFAVSGGVAAAVKDYISRVAPEKEVKMQCADGLRECRKMLLMAKAGKYDGYLLEGMACPGGCVAGAGTITPVEQSKRNVVNYSAQAPKKSSDESGFADMLRDAEQ